MRTQYRGVAVDLIRHPGLRQPVRPQTLLHGLRELGLGVEHHLRQHPRPLATRHVSGPASGQVQVPIQQHVPPRAGTSQEHAHLDVLNLARRAGVLVLHPDRVLSLPQEARPIEDHQRLRSSKVSAMSSCSRSRAASASQRLQDNRRCLRSGWYRPPPRPVASCSCVPVRGPRGLAGTWRPIRAARHDHRGLRSGGQSQRAPWPIPADLPCPSFLYHRHDDAFIIVKPTVGASTVVVQGWCPASAP